MSTSYVLPQVKVFQEFTQTPAAASNPLRAFIFGPNYFIERYENGGGLLGQYNPSADTSFLWPNRPVGAIVDQDFTKVTIKNALLRYYTNLTGDIADEIHAVPGKPNQIRAEAINFKDNGAAFPLSSAFNGREVQIGDIARVYANVNGSLEEVWTRIIDILPDYSTPTFDSMPDPDINNSGALIGGNDAASNVGTGGGTRSIATDAIGSGIASTYNGLADGFPQETYTIEITTASDASGNGALAKVTSASGTDDAVDVPITPTNQSIGTRGVLFNWSGSGPFNVGDKWILTVRQSYTPPTVTASGTFDSDTDTTYIVEVTRGGDESAGDTLQISVSTTNGLDVSGPHDVTNKNDVAIGTKGLLIKFDGGSNLELVKGEKWYISATGRKIEGYKTLVLADNLPADLQAHAAWWPSSGGHSSSTISSFDVNLQLFVSKDISLPKENFANPPNLNWTQSDTEITLKAGAQVFDSEFVDSTGNFVPLTLDADPNGLYSIAYVTYRALLQTHASDISSLSDISEVENVLGEVSEDNPLALAVWYALRNSNGTDVKFMAVPTDDLNGYNQVLDKATGRRDIYTLVPTTKDPAIQNAIASHVDAMSTETRGQWRIAFFNGESSASIGLIDVGLIYPEGGTTQYTDADLLATISDDPDTSGTQYTLVVWDSNSFPAGGGFVDMGVRPGDTLRINYRGDGFGGTVFDEYVIDAVISNQQLRLKSGPDSPITVPSKFAVYKTLTKDEEATEYGKKAGVFANRRIYYVWPDKIEDGAGQQIDGFYACAAIAGLISSVVPQQGLTNVALEGFSAVTRTTEYFSESQLDTMAGSGVWIIDQNPDTGEIFNRHEVSTSTVDVNQRELMVVKNVDSISFTFLNQLAPFIGRANVTPRFLTLLRRQIMSTSDFLKAQGATPSLGGQLIDAEIAELRPHTINKDQVVVVLNITIPYPVNVIELKLVI